jgi:hypothetical protein
MTSFRRTSSTTMCFGPKERDGEGEDRQATEPHVRGLQMLRR